ncbi:MAG: tRNA (guanosine(46)-N7)-methyltransferase TrmB [Rhodospirillaceae bacterium]|nr:tRNA (guanosine(46)-N7)-methyltransferase TrmB [Rhodospirillaceae bacterium]
MSPATEPQQRGPRFYGRRKGRPLRAAQERRLATLLPRLAVVLPPEGGRRAPPALFPFPVSDVWLEIGFGAGEHLVAQAAAHPHVGFIGCEIFRNGIAALLRLVETRGLDNLRIFPDDARLLMPALPEAGIGRCFVLFPDPWPKARHAARRFIGPANLDELARLLKDGAELRVASDDAGHVAWVMEQVSAHPAFDAPPPVLERPADWPPTRYEAKAIAAGRRPHYFTFRRRGRRESGPDFA